MVRKRSPDRAAESPRIDDLKLINGIGPAVEKRLNGVGILTFAQLAALSPADIAAAVADLSGLSSERIIKQDWIGQAHKLAAEAMASEAQEDIEAPAVIEEVTVFTFPAESPTPMEHVELQQADQLTPEAISGEAQEDIEAPAVIEEVTVFTIPAEPQASLEPTQDVTLSEEPEEDAVPSMERYHPASFTVEFLLDENNDLLSTHIVHVQSGREDTWTGWQKAQLVDFLSESAGLNIPSDEAALLKAEEPVSPPALVEEPVNTEEPVPAVITESEPVTPLAANPSLTGTLRWREMEVIEVTSGSPRRTLTHDEPFDVRLTLDLSELQVPDNTPLNYKASIYGRERGGSSGLVLGEAQGTIIPADTVTIKVEENTLPEGIYHLAGTVTIGLPGMRLVVKPGRTAVIDGGQVQVL